MSALAAYSTPRKCLRDRHIHPSQHQGAADACARHRQQAAEAA